MPLTISDPSTVAALTGAAGTQELRTSDGRVLGRYIPAVPGMTFPESGLTDDELRRRAADPDGWVTAEAVEARLRSLSGAA
jgi:hypothetical protein